MPAAILCDMRSNAISQLLNDGVIRPEFRPCGISPGAETAEIQRVT